MKKVIVTTTINPVTEAIRRFQAMNDWELVVAGDLKTPKDYRLERGTYLTPAMQESFDKELSDAIGWNSIQRRIFACLWAHRMGADIVALVDDDNIPYESWGKNLTLGKPTEVNFYVTELPVFDPVGAAGTPHLWHRGFPLQLLSKRDYTRVEKRIIVPDVQADFWDGDPDIDAICRMEHAPSVEFHPKHFPLASNALSPFNSQNTFLSAKLLADYCLFPHIGRMDDIWASFYVQAKGAKVVYGTASVFQARNVHDLTKDFKLEIIGYENTLNLINSLHKDPESILKFLPQRSKTALELYRRHFEVESTLRKAS